MPHHHKRQIQFELFVAADDANTVTTPTWQDLPARTRRKVTSLMVRLLAEHGREQCALPSEDGSVHARENRDV